MLRRSDERNYRKNVALLVSIPAANPADWSWTSADQSATFGD